MHCKYNNVFAFNLYACVNVKQINTPYLNNIYKIFNMCCKCKLICHGFTVDIQYIHSSCS